MTSSIAVEIHGYVTCPFAWRVRLAAAEKGVTADWIPCDVERPDPRARSHNPDEHSPLLWTDGFTLTESEVIIHYLDEALPGPPLMPSAPRPRAELRLLAARLKSLDAHKEHSRPAARRQVEPPLRVLEAALGDQAFLHGASPGVADTLFWPFLADLGVRGLLAAPAYPRASAYLTRSAARPAFRDTRPPWALGL
jgi:glutathione S-transferase